MSNIPEKSRTLVRTRARHRCERCRASAVNGHWHHRRSRRVKDQHTHCPCNGVWLCGPCHIDVHAHPAMAREGGWVLSQWVEEPGTVPIAGRTTPIRLGCLGGFTFVFDE